MPEELPLDFFLVADLKFVAMMTARENGAGSYCMWCELLKKFWATQTAGAAVTREALLAIRATQETYTGDAKWAEAHGKRLGVQSAYLLSSVILIHNVLVPTLHIMLGLTMNLLTMMVTYLETAVEGKPPEYVVAKSERVEWEAKVKVAEEERAAFEVGLAAGDEEHKEEMERRFCLMTNGSTAKKHMLVKNVLMTNHAYTNIVTSNASRACKNHLAKRNEWRLKALALRALKKELAAKESEEKRQLAVFKDAVKSWDRWPGHVDRILKKYKIEREVYNGHSLTGTMCKKLFKNIASVVDDLVELVREEQEGEQDENPLRETVAAVQAKLNRFKVGFQKLGVIDKILSSLEQVPQTDIDGFGELAGDCGKGRWIQRQHNESARGVPEQSQVKQRLRDRKSGGAVK